MIPLTALVPVAVLLRIGVPRAFSALDRRRTLGRVPELYPDLDDEALCAVFPPARAAEHLRSIVVEVTPFEGDSERARHAGRGLTEMLRRALLPVRGLSVVLPTERRAARDLATSARRRGWTVSGTLSFSVDGLRCEVRARHAERADVAFSSASGTISGLLGPVVERLASELGASLDARTRRALGIERLRSVESLIRLGSLAERVSKGPAPCAGTGVDLLTEVEALALMRSEPELSIAGWFLGGDRLQELLRLHRTDPDDPHLAFTIASELVREGLFVRRAFQFLRRTLELCPAHGPANMLAAHAAIEPRRMGHHSALAFQLLEHDPWVATRHAVWLLRYGRSPQESRAVAEAVIERWPHHPGAYSVLMSALEQLGDRRRAAEVGSAWLRWLQPELHPDMGRAFALDRAVAEEMDRGRFDPASEVRTRLEKLSPPVG